MIKTNGTVVQSSILFLGGGSAIIIKYEKDMQGK